VSVRLGVDVGGTKLEIVALAPDGRQLLRLRQPTPRQDYDAAIAAIVRLVREAEDEVGPGSVGIGMPGTISPASGVVKNANSTWLNGRPFHADLEAALARPVRLANDANCFALSEAVDGAAAGARTVFGVILGTGTGAGIVVDGRPLVGPNAIAGEWGHNPMPWPHAEEWPGPPCYCGRTGCIEVFLSGPGLAAECRRLGGAADDGKDVERRASAGDAHAASALASYRGRLARGLAHVVNILDPDVIVLGGGLSNLAGLAEAVMAGWNGFVFSDRVDTPVRQAAHGDSSGVRGAAWLWPPPAR
jgi:fructokinase